MQVLTKAREEGREYITDGQNVITLIYDATLCAPLRKCWFVFESKTETCPFWV